MSPPRLDGRVLRIVLTIACTLIVLAGPARTAAGQSFAAPLYPLDYPAQDIVTLDLAAAGGPDLAVLAGEQIDLLRALPGGGYETTDVIATGDFGGRTYFVLLRGDGTGAFEAELYGTGGSSNRPVPWLLDDDALPDIVCLASSQARVSLNLGLSSQWADLGYGLAGTNGVPQLVGTGALEPGSSGTLKLSNALPNKLAVLFISKQSNPAPFKGGILATVPPLISFMLVTSPVGAINLSWRNWPGGAPGGTWYFQYGVVDPGGPAGAALSNAVRRTQP